ncbi:type II toxin-antitoxin system VapC family toxin [Dyadobacter sp.]|uniref:type II toxin-antitoxin system VapC family toxin n=1 Tax=Dyadobacter sp. TaxID=1914288 RepID=UPI003F6FAFE5
MIDTSILIDFYRKTDKNKSAWVNLVREGYDFAISVVTKYEIYSGATESQLTFWEDVLLAVTVIPLGENAVDTAVETNKILKRKRKQIALADLLIASSAIASNLPLATLNRKHFERIENLVLIP